MIEEKTVSGMILTVEPRRIYDEERRAYTDQVETTETGSPRYRLTLAIPGEREPLPVTVDADQMTAAGLDPDDAAGRLVSLTVRQRVDVRWSVATALALPVDAEDFA